jgi:hypothetical protein
MLDGHLALMLAGRSTGTSDTNQSSPNKVIRLGN